MIVNSNRTAILMISPALILKPKLKNPEKHILIISTDFLRAIERPGEK